jgi:putative spermidine/putrescine transport system permease protein
MSLWLRIFLGCWTIAVITFLILPIVAIMPLAFSADTFLSYPIRAFSMRWFSVVFADYPWLFALKNSLIVGAATVLLAVPLGTLAAYGLSLRKFLGHELVMGLLIAPMVVPVVIIGLASFLVLSHIGLLGTFTGMILAHTVLALPFVVIPVSATLKGYDRNLTRAAHSLGAPPVGAFLAVTLPLILPGVLSGAVFAFITSFDEVVVALFVSSPATLTLPRQLFSGLRDQLDPSLVAIALVLILVSCLTMGTANFLSRRAFDKSRPEV